MKKVVFHEMALLQMEETIQQLVEKGYFSEEDYAAEATLLPSTLIGIRSRKGNCDTLFIVRVAGRHGMLFMKSWKMFIA